MNVKKAKLVEKPDKRFAGGIKRYYSVKENDKELKFDNSPTKILGFIYPFSFNTKIGKAWAQKECNKGNQKLCLVAANIEEFDNVAELSRINGNHVHSALQTHLRERDYFNYEKLEAQAFIYFIDKFPNYEIIDMETPLVDIESGSTCKVDLLIKSYDDYIMVDFKTGSNVAYDKLKKVKLQLGAYKPLLESYYNIKITKAYCFQINEDMQLIDLSENLEDYEKQFFQLREKVLELKKLKKEVK